MRPAAGPTMVETSTVLCRETRGGKKPFVGAAISNWAEEWGVAVPMPTCPRRIGEAARMERSDGSVLFMMSNG
jgi:hypothetical protein